MFVEGLDATEEDSQLIYSDVVNVREISEHSVIVTFIEEKGTGV
jgi:hypothetical protein